MVPAEGVVVAPGPGAVVRQITQLVHVETVQTRTQVEQLPGYSVKVNNSHAIYETPSRDVGSPLRVQQPDLPLHVHGALPSLAELRLSVAATETDNNTAVMLT